MNVPDWVAADPLPPQWSASENALRVNRYADVAAVLRHPDMEVVELSAEVAKLAARSGRSFSNLINLFGGVAFFRNPPAHAKIRRMMRQSLDMFAPDLTASAIRNHVDFLLGAVNADEPIDAVSALSLRLPILVIARALGLAEDIATAIRRSSARLIEASHRVVPFKTYERLEKEASDLTAILVEQIAASAGKATGLSRMIALAKTDYGFDNSAIAACTFYLILASVETASALLGNAIYLLSSHPNELDRLRSTPAMMTSCLNEIMRFAGALRRLNARVATTDLRLADVVIEAGTAIILMIEQAHRDPAVYADPSRFDIARQAPPHFGFGAGIHACLGSALARLEATTLVTALLDRFDIELLDTAPQWEENPDLRRLATLKLVLRPVPKGQAT